MKKFRIIEKTSPRTKEKLFILEERVLLFFWVLHSIYGNYNSAKDYALNHSKEIIHKVDC